MFIFLHVRKQQNFSIRLIYLLRHDETVIGIISLLVDHVVLSTESVGVRAVNTSWNNVLKMTRKFASVRWYGNMLSALWSGSANTTKWCCNINYYVGQLKSANCSRIYYPILPEHALIRYYISIIARKLCF